MPGTRRPLKNLKEFCNPAQWETIVAAVNQLWVQKKEPNVIGTAEAYLSRIANIRVWENGRPTSRAGQASTGKWQLELHSELLRPGREQDCHDTLIHEVGHFLSAGVFDYHGHGKPWTRCMVALGVPNETRCHSYPYLGREAEHVQAKMKVEYTCKDCGYIFRRTRRWNEARGYFHRECRLKLNGGALKRTRG